MLLLDRPAWGGVVLGIFRDDWNAEAGDAAVSGKGLGHGNRGWGFGVHQHQSERGQAYGWAGQVLPGPVVFEIAVTDQDLSSDDSKAVLR